MEAEASSGRAVSAALPVGLCQGYDTVLGQGRNTVLTGDYESVGASSGVSYRVCVSKEELFQAFHVDQASTVEIGGVASVSQKLQFVQSLKVTSTSVSIAIYAQSTQRTETVTNVSLNSGIQVPTSSLQELAEFFKVYGDSYLSSRTSGGEYCALYLYSTETQEEQHQLTTELKAAGVMGKGSVDASLETKLNKFNSNSKYMITFDQKLSGIANQELPTPNDMIAFALRFPSLPLTAPSITQFHVTGYERVPGIGSHFNPIAENRNLIAHDAHFTKKLNQLQALQNSISSIKEIYTFYKGYKDEKLESVQTQADTDMKAVADMIRGYTADPTKSVVLPVLRSLDSGIPFLKFLVGQSPVYGGYGGSPYDGVPDVRKHLRQKIRITALQLRTGRVVDQLAVSYSDGRKLRHGHDTGGLHNAAVLDFGTYVTSMSGFYNNVSGVTNSIVLQGLTITLSNGRQVPGFGGSGGNKFNWKVPTDKKWFVLGFRGRSGLFLDQVQVVYAAFTPAVWSSA